MRAHLSRATRPYLQYALDRTDVEGRDADSPRACRPGLGVVVGDRVSEDDPVGGDVELADLGVVGACA